ncbi:glycosyltransferase [Novosphingobium sp. MMS21-SN21R]|uniref:glycosyltransferase family 2 protein n=1 Tax=Novosphingobium sp. MMS21-SN21R TaxID=2969298 RepID=UPI002885FA91|nr:glycosyltransferase [Novosphingobium sp. MMS21-SN21R]MDT0508391.1 glycosyltransferase [Novosphingobium sp. MMS21-SN21R]
MKLYVIVASIGRAELLAATIGQLSDQTRHPDGVLVVSVSEADVAGVAMQADFPVEIIFAEMGLPKQRNAGLRHLAGKADIIVFFDDDFVPCRTYLAELEALFESRPEVVGATGRVIADGIKTRGISFTEAVRLNAEDVPPAVTHEREMPALYGCNLSARASATKDLWFDENLPLYGWQEDVDFSYQLGKRGKLLLTDRLAGVHMGAKSGRTSGRRLGYSQIANPVYLLRKNTIPHRLAWRLMVKNVAANALRTLRPEPYIDRRGRLVGNLLAIRDYARGRLHPMLVWDL